MLKNFKRITCSIVMTTFLLTNTDSFVNTTLANENNETNTQSIHSNYKYEIAPQFQVAESFSDGLARVKSDVSGGLYGYIDKTGKLVIPYKFKEAFDFSDGLARVYDEKTNKYGFIDKTGELVIPYELYEAGDFSEGRAQVTNGLPWFEGRLVGYIDTKGELVIPYSFYKALDFSEGLAWVSTPEGIQFIDVNGNGNGKIFNASNSCTGLNIAMENFEEGLIVAYTTIPFEYSYIYDKAGYLDTNGNLVIPYKFDSGGLFSDGLADVYDEELNKWGFIDKNGDLVIPYKFDKIGIFSEGLCLVYDDEKQRYAYINKNGEYITDYVFYPADVFSEGFAVVSKGYGYGYIDKTGNLVVPYTFSDAKSFKEGLALVLDDDTGLYGYISLVNEPLSIEEPDKIEEIIDYEIIDDNAKQYIFTKDRITVELPKPTTDDFNEVDIRESFGSESVFDGFLKYSDTNKILISETARKIEINNEDETVNNVKITFDLEGIEIDDDDKSKLIAVHYKPSTYEISYVGGTFNDETKQFITMTNYDYGMVAVIIGDERDYKKAEFFIDNNNFTSNGIENTLDVAPTIINNVTYVPIRAVTETLGSEIDYEPKEKTAIITVNDKKVSFTLNGENDIKNKPLIINSRMMIPLRDAMEALGANVIWNEKNKSIQITK